ncbi:MAG TPA: Hsp33 family molecular chaperone HslO [Bdellovibrionales bacterium]|nr:Hsp33 family molecular chaperone HslO [Bdellovibrionales bacterium]
MAQDMSRWTKYLSKTGNVRVVTIEAKPLIDEIAQRHGLSGDLLQGISDATLAGLLFAACQKGGERVNLSIQGSGKWKQAVVDAYPEGFVRAYIAPGQAEDWSNPSRGPWGNGLLTILHTKNAEGQRPYSGTVSLETGYLDQDLAFYWHQSEQLTSNVVISGPRAILAQAIAGATPEELKMIEACRPELQEIAKADISKPVALLEKAFPNAHFAVVEETPLKFRCNCSQERVEEAMLLTSADDVRYLLGDNDHIDVKCDFCGQKYQLSRQKAESIIGRMNKGKA